MRESSRDLIYCISSMPHHPYHAIHTTLFKPHHPVHAIQITSSILMPMCQAEPGVNVNQLSPGCHGFVSSSSPDFVSSSCPGFVKKKGKGMFLYSAVSSPLDRSKRFTLSSPDRPVHSDTVLCFSWKHSSHAAIAQRLFTHISTTVYSQVFIYTAESTEAS